MEINLVDILDAAEYASALKPDGPDGDPDFYDNAIIGITDDGRLVYGKELMVMKLEEFDDEMDYTEAFEFLEYNCFYAGVGEMTPLFINQYL
jgi:hypothetical protein